MPAPVLRRPRRLRPTRLPRAADPELTVTEPIGKPIPTGKKIAFVSCGVEACAVQGPILAGGREDLGWTVEQVATDGTPEKLQARSTGDPRGRRRRDPQRRQPATRSRSRSPTPRSQASQFVTCCSIAEPAETASCSTPATASRTPRSATTSRPRSSPTAGQGQRAVRQHLGVRDPQAVGDAFERSSRSTARVRRRLDRHPADGARQGRAGPDHLLPARPPEGELRRALGQ